MKFFFHSFTKEIETRCRREKSQNEEPHHKTEEGDRRNEKLFQEIQRKESGGWSKMKKPLNGAFAIF